uniref:OTU domain-containing protein n=1 Tax=viral metagenome TaxID=1070528 RepID=A0A6C0IS02_9ZZZZ
MVKSFIYPDKIQYNETKEIDNDDVGHASTIYEIDYFDKPINIALGRESHSFSGENIVHFSIYLVSNDKIHSRIGVFEVESNKMISIIDEDGDIDIDQGHILLFVDQQYVFEHVSSDDNKNDDETDIKETEQIDKLTFVENEHNDWIANFMKNNNYHIVDNEGKGDCLFLVIQMALEGTEHETNVEELRKILANNVNETLFEQYKSIYMGIHSELQNVESNMKHIKELIQKLKKQCVNVSNKQENKAMLDRITELRDSYAKANQEKNSVNELMSEFVFMQHISNIDDLKKYVLTSNYWADTWAIGVLEKKLNIKLVVFSEESHKSNDLDSVLLCGQDNEQTSQPKNPDYYVLTSYTGNHYTLITYDTRKRFTFSTLPSQIKSLVINKCIEKNAGPYYSIPEFRQLKMKLGIHVDEGKLEDPDDEYLNDHLYNNKTVFMFHANSNGAPKPGQGSGEKIDNDVVVSFKELILNHKRNNWRRQLDDSYLSPFTLDGHRWNSVEHYKLASQFKKGYPDFYHSFSLDSDSPISKDLIKARIAGSKSGRSKDKVYRERHITVDPDYYEFRSNPRHEIERFDALKAKFCQNPDLKHMLQNTNDTKLIHFVRGNEPDADILLMKLRKDIDQICSQ